MTFQSFSSSFGPAFDAVRAAGTPPQHVTAHIGDRPPGPADTGNVGDLWLDMSSAPFVTYVYFPAPANTPPQWHLVAEFAERVEYVSSHRLWEACLLMALRNYQVMNAPLGLAGGYDIGAVYVGRIDADYSRLLRGYRAQHVPLLQEWPTVDEVAARMQMSPGTTATVDLNRALDAAIEQVFVDVSRTFGVG